jgi:hypothetical protein
MANVRHFFQFSLSGTDLKEEQFCRKKEQLANQYNLKLRGEVKTQ